MGFPEPIERMIEELSRLPGIGPKSAQRIAFHLLFRPKDEVERLADALVSARSQVRYCSVCADLTVQDPCMICSSPRRDGSILCVVEDPKDVVAIERTREFSGRFHVLHGAISPMDGIGPEQLRIRELLERLRSDEVKEVIIATGPDVEGEATALYLSRLIKPIGVTVTRIARGLPEGSELDYADEATLSRALEGRREL